MIDFKALEPVAKAEPMADPNGLNLNHLRHKTVLEFGQVFDLMKSNLCHLKRT